MDRSAGSERLCDESREKMRLTVMSEETGTEPLPGLQQDVSSEQVPTVPLIERFEDVEELKCRVQKVTMRGDVSGGTEEEEGGEQQNNAYVPSASGSGRESTLSLSSDDTLNCDDCKSESTADVSSLAHGCTTTKETSEPAADSAEPGVVTAETKHERTNSDTSSSTSTSSSIKAGLLMSPVLLTEDVPVDVGASNRLSSVLENISLPLLYLPTTKQIVNGDETVGYLQTEQPTDPDALPPETLTASRSDSSFQQGTGVGLEGRPISLFRTGSSCSDFDRLKPEPDRVTLNSVESFTSATLSVDPARLYDTSSLSSISTGTDFSMEHAESRLMMGEGDENTFIEVNLHGRNSYETSRNSSLDSGFEDRGAKPKKKGISGFLARGLFSRKSKEDSAPGWKLFGRVPPKDSGPRDSSQISSDYYAKQRANQIAAAQAKGQNSEVMSTTALILENRPEGLPSKSPEELEKHRLEYESMVEAARKKEQRDLKLKKRKLQQQRRHEDKMVAAASMWNKDVLPHWETMRQTKKVRELWWMGLPPNVRGKVWQMAVGNDLNITKDLYEICRSRAEDRIRLIQECKDAPGSPETITEPPSSKEASVKVIKLDVSRTFPHLCIFQKGGPYHDLMHNLLGAYACYRPDVGYVQGMSFIAAILLLNMDVADAFVCFANLLNRPCQVTFFRMDQDMMGAYYKTFEEFFLENLPELCQHFETLQLTPNLYLMEWIFLLYSKSLPLDVACRVWDVYFRDGEEFLFQTALGILKLYEAVLLKMDFISVAQFLTKLPDDLSADLLFRAIETVRMVIDKRRFPAVLATKKDFKADTS